MAQSSNRSGSGTKAGGSKSASGGGRRRTPAPPVKKPFPWGVVATSAILAVLLIGILVYAVMNQGSGYSNALQTADKDIKGVKVTNGLKRDHVEGPVKYATSPPVGGPHNSSWENCGVYTKPVPNEHAVHSLEHGAVWITYRPDLPADQVKTLDAFYSTQPYLLVSPYPGLGAPITLQAWGRQLRVDNASDSRIANFVKTYAQGPQTPEKGSACTGGTSATGSLTSETGGTPGAGTMNTK